MSERRKIRILGIRGIPARHGGFETFVERLAPYLRANGWDVTVYCQEPGEGPIRTDVWCGIERVLVPSGPDTPFATIKFDLASIRHAARFGDICLTLGYNTAIFTILLRARGVTSILNMDGIEWRRSKWSLPARIWFYLNDWAGCLISSHLIADNPHIKALVERRTTSDRVTCIPYGTDLLTDQDCVPLSNFGLEPDRYLTLIARPEPENSILELVTAFSCRPRGVKLIVVGKLRDDHRYHEAVRAAAGDEVVFVGEIYDRVVLAALRRHCIAYLHGHQVGGTNPSLLEAMGAGNPVVAHGNRFNRWVADDCALYFNDLSQADEAITRLLTDDVLRRQLGNRSRERAATLFSWDSVFAQYHNLLLRWAEPAEEKEFSNIVPMPDDIEVVRVKKSR